MHITPPNDSATLTKLNRPKALRRAEKPVSETEASNPSQPVSDEHEHQQRKHEERRELQRRNDQGRALLDTRDHHERRTRMRREEDREQETGTPPSPAQGIDVTA